MSKSERRRERIQRRLDHPLELEGKHDKLRNNREAYDKRIENAVDWREGLKPKKGECYER